MKPETKTAITEITAALSGAIKGETVIKKVKKTIDKAAKKIAKKVAKIQKEEEKKKAKEAKKLEKKAKKAEKKQKGDKKKETSVEAPVAQKVEETVAPKPTVLASKAASAKPKAATVAKSSGTEGK